MKQQLRGKELFLVGVTLFSMFFGAGNLIFPPFVGYQAGSVSLPAFLGMALTAVCFPVLGVVENKAYLSTEGGEILLGTDPKEHADAIGVPLIATVPLSLELSVMADFGRISDADVPELDPVAELLVK